MTQLWSSRLRTEEFQALFVWQQDEFSCGPACLATVAKIYGIGNVDYQFFRNSLNPIPTVGSCNLKMVDVSRAHLPFESAGEDSYKQGIAVANIIDGGEGHYVVFLARKGDKIIYYDPYEHDIVVTTMEKMKWISESGHLKRWSINFLPQQDKNFDFWLRFSI